MSARGVRAVKVSIIGQRTRSLHGPSRVDVAALVPRVHDWKKNVERCKRCRQFGGGRGGGRVPDGDREELAVHDGA